MSLFGIESEADCRKELDELLELHSAAKRAMSEEAIAALKSRLKGYYEKRTGRRGHKASNTEEQYFCPAIQEAYVNAPNLRSRKTWNQGLRDVEFYLNYYRPK
jgi:hypothetical protein